MAAILDGRQPRGLTVNAMLKGVPEVWEERRKGWGFGESVHHAYQRQEAWVAIGLAEKASHASNGSVTPS